jgi:hypothetical protein
VALVALEDFCHATKMHQESMLGLCTSVLPPQNPDKAVNLPDCPASFCPVTGQPAAKLSVQRWITWSTNAPPSAVTRKISNPSRAAPLDSPALMQSYESCMIFAFSSQRYPCQVHGSCRNGNPLQHWEKCRWCRYEDGEPDRPPPRTSTRRRCP